MNNPKIINKQINSTKNKTKGHTMISQLTVFLENKEGRLCDATRTIANAGINMHALNIAESSDFGVLRVICDTPEAAAKTLNDAGFRATCTPVLAIRVSGAAGGLADLLEKLDDLDVNIEYGYCYSTDAEYAINVLKVKSEAVEVSLRAAGVCVLDASDVYKD